MLLIIPEPVVQTFHERNDTMKKWMIFLLTAGLALLLLPACTSVYSTATGPGSVIGQAPGESGQNKVITFTVKGKGVEPESALTRGQARLMAERAAVADGYRQFVEKLRGVYVQAYSRAGYGTVDQDMIATRTQSVLRGVEIKEITHQEYGITQAVMQLRVNFTKQQMIWWPQGLGNVSRPAL
jgi:hypothetical protein